MRIGQINRVIFNCIKYAATSLLVLKLFSCGKSSDKPESIELIADTITQNSIFKSLARLVNGIPESVSNDSLAFLILPIEASCPSCRNKTIDSIVKHLDDLAKNHFIIISASAGRKTINSYFRERDTELSNLPNHIFLDSTNQAYKDDLYNAKPTMYYTYNQKAYKKVGAAPATVRNDLSEFFSGHRNEKHLGKN
jgi:hypothetical protein